MTWHQYIQSLTPSKMAVFFRKKLAHNQGCPPASLMQVLSMCDVNASCDNCWWAWLNTERSEVDSDERCWDCRWGARDDAGGSPVVACMHEKFKGAIMGPNDYCSNFDERYWEEKPKPEYGDDEDLDRLTSSDQEKIAQEIRRKREIRLIRQEFRRRAKAKKRAEEREAKQNAGVECVLGELQPQEDRDEEHLRTRGVLGGPEEGKEEVQG